MPAKFLATLFLALALSACGGEPPAEETASTTSVKLALNWFPEAEHGGFYAAQVHGYYEAAGLTVDILGGGPDAPVIQRVATDQVAFGVTNADGVLNARAQQAPVVALMAPYQISPRVIMVHESSGIENIADIRDITLSLSARPAFSHYLRKKYPFEGVTIVPYSGNIAPFLINEQYAQQGYIFSEPFVAKSKGATPRSLLVAETGFNPYASLLIATEETIAQRPEVVAAMVKASLQGWQRYMDDPEETNRRINQANPEMGLDILAFGAQTSRELVLDETAQKHGLGHMALERWQILLEQMIKAELIDSGAVDPQQAFTTGFLP
ncbi:MAG: myristoyl transferase [Candidatus Latescibacteria bacterium]|nr:myristoyl transferase [Candidatus Latescibacterota bacterium]